MWGQPCADRYARTYSAPVLVRHRLGDRPGRRAFWINQADAVRLTQGTLEDSMRAGFDGERCVINRAGSSRLWGAM